MLKVPTSRTHHVASPEAVHGESSQSCSKLPQTSIVTNSHVLLQLMSNHWKEAIKWRVLYFARTRKGAEGHTIMLRDIPGPASTGFLGKIFDVRPLLLVRFWRVRCERCVQHFAKCSTQC